MTYDARPTTNGPQENVTPIRPGTPCGAKWPEAANIFCNRAVGHKGSHEHIDFSYEDPTDCEVVAVWP